MTQHERHLVELALKIVFFASGVKDSGYSSTKFQYHFQPRPNCDYLERRAHAVACMEVSMVFRAKKSNMQWLSKPGSATNIRPFLERQSTTYLYGFRYFRMWLCYLS